MLVLVHGLGIWSAALAAESLLTRTPGSADAMREKSMTAAYYVDASVGHS